MDCLDCLKEVERLVYGLKIKSWEDTCFNETDGVLTGAEIGTGLDGKNSMCRMELQVDRLCQATGQTLNPKFRIKDYTCVIAILLKDRDLPDVSLDREHCMTALEGEIHHKSLRFIIDGELTLSSSFYGKESAVDSLREPKLPESQKLEVLNRCTITKYRYVTVSPHTYYTHKTNQDGSILLHLIPTNSKVTTICGAQYASVAASGPLAWKACAPDQRQELIQHLLQRLNVPPRALPFDMTTKTSRLFTDYLYSQLEELSKAMTNRHLAPGDHLIVQHVGEAFALYVKHGGKINRSLKIEKMYSVYGREKQLFLTRIHYIPKSITSDKYQVRIHIFADPTEEVPHNHNSNAISMALVGSYKHSTYTTVPSSHSLTSRSYQNDKLSPPHPINGKRLERVDSYDHTPHNVYFLSQETLHTVQVPKVTDGACASSGTCSTKNNVITLFVKDNLNKRTYFVVNDDSKMPDETRTEEVTDEVEKEAIFQHVECSIKATIISI